MISCKSLRPSLEGALAVYRLAFDCRPDVDEHEFATAYVNHVAETGHKPDVFEAIYNFSKTGKVT